MLPRFSVGNALMISNAFFVFLRKGRMVLGIGTALVGLLSRLDSLDLT